ncbi:hypothetical protein OCGS_1889 [Oceaniovalibus guishaninsula JLT2003]|uniref:Gamma-glutamylcyclotransferase AIG2-like domain-containing protein n=1 Tax=Oceaniovalibus guishaninsula JLT2003 TaxID=1231392 RepID=K2H8J1_9RHOB|nr:gamma-glutamylcyclotransferase family protein [Oceaniovalibus guishaninsula]EKE43908.1 hypothetical protein OCGS_1889 [Oceaniovalibus guishaninsula JLT2003]
MTDPHFFGYGSLVNLTTHDYAPARPAILHGWRRVWRTTDRRRAAFLTAVPAPGHAVEGMIAPVPGADWQALDTREAGYDRLPAPRVDHGLRADTTIAVYAIPAHHALPGPARPVLLSYLDVVVQGYARQFGAEGVARFFATTDGWGAVADDRAAPLYPRARRLDPAETALVDTHLAALGVPCVAPEDAGLADGLRRPAP